MSPSIGFLLPKPLATTTTTTTTRHKSVYGHRRRRWCRTPSSTAVRFYRLFEERKKPGGGRGIYRMDEWTTGDKRVQRFGRAKLKLVLRLDDPPWSDVWGVVMLRDAWEVVPSRIYFFAPKKALPIAVSTIVWKTPERRWPGNTSTLSIHCRYDQW